MAGQIRIGEFHIDVNNIEFKQFATGNGERAYRKYIKFDPDLSGTVSVVVALNHIDKAEATGLRVVASAQNVDREGFDLVISTWADTKLSGVGCSWIAAYG